MDDQISSNRVVFPQYSNCIKTNQTSFNARYFPKQTLSPLIVSENSQKTAEKCDNSKSHTKTAYFQNSVQSKFEFVEPPEPGGVISTLRCQVRIGLRNHHMWKRFKKLKEI